MVFQSFADSFLCTYSLVAIEAQKIVYFLGCKAFRQLLTDMT